jgi:NitT/TauT family transport system permease protein
MSAPDLTTTRTGAGRRAGDEPTVVVRAPAGRRRAPQVTRNLRRLQDILIAPGFVLAVWLTAVEVLGVPDYILPTPRAVVTDLVDRLYTAPVTHGLDYPSGYWLPLAQTVSVTAIGFALGVVLALCLALLSTVSRIADRVTMPVVASFQSMPKIALAPLFVIWIGVGGESRIALSAAMVFFPMLVNARTGLVDVNPNRLMMAQSFGGNTWRTLWKIRLPSSLPAIFTGMELGIVYAVMGTVVGEFTAGSEGLGARLLSEQAINNVASVFSILLIFAVVGASLHAAMRLLRRLVVRWPAA